MELDEVSHILLTAANTIKTDNNLTDLQATIGLRSNFNSDTSRAISERCPWVPAPTCDPNKHFRSWDGSCNNLRDPNLGRTGTPYQRILLPEYAKVSDFDFYCLHFSTPCLAEHGHFLEFLTVR